MDQVETVPEPSDPRDARYRLGREVAPAGDKDGLTVDQAGRPISAGIDGVRTVPLVSHVDHRGTLTEAVNFDNEFWDEPVVYSYCITIRPGRIKGWGMHRKQADRYFIASGHLRVVLFDGRVDSPTYRSFAEFHLTEEARALLLIPPGVWHGDQNWGERDAILMNFPTRPFDRNDPDKYRIDPYSGTIPFAWSLPEG
jgi:dTDP-4-dehydrorhamnose 3,5-epimerase